jgi:hypothetical protein
LSILIMGSVKQYKRPIEIFMHWILAFKFFNLRARQNEWFRGWY